MMTVDDIKVFSDLLNTILNAILLIEGGGDGGKRIDALNYNKNLIHGKTHQQQKKQDAAAAAAAADDDDDDDDDDDGGDCACR